MKILSHDYFIIQDIKEGITTNYGFKSSEDAMKYIKFLVERVGENEDNFVLDVITVVENVDELVKNLERKIKLKH